VDTGIEPERTDHGISKNKGESMCERERESESESESKCDKQTHRRGN